MAAAGLVDQSARTRINPYPASARWGLGWDSVQQIGLNAAGLGCWNKNGGTFFFSSDFFVLPPERLAVMLTGCGFDYGPARLAEGVLLRAAVERNAIRALPAAIVSTVPPAISPAPASTTVTGVYANYDHPSPVLAASDGWLTLRSWSATGWTTLQEKLRARTDGDWWTDGKDDRCYRFQTEDGHRYLIQRDLSSN